MSLNQSDAGGVVGKMSLCPRRRAVCSTTWSDHVVAAVLHDAV